jgi:hypothetical protein
MKIVCIIHIFSTQVKPSGIFFVNIERGNWTGLQGTEEAIANNATETKIELKTWSTVFKERLNFSKINAT